MTVTKLFDRQIIVEIGPKGGLGKSISGLRVTFKAEQTAESKPNKATIEITNLSKASIDEFTKRDSPNGPTGLYLILKAGYPGNTDVVFQGDIARVIKKKVNGTDVVLTFECADGLEEIQNSTVNQSFKPGTSFSDVLSKFTESMGLAPGAQEGVQPETFLNGFSFSGFSRDGIDQLTQKQGLTWSIQDGTLVIRPQNTAIPGEAILLTSETGLIGTPERSDTGVEIRSLLQPKIRPGQLVRVDSSTVKGDFLCEKVTHVGDNFGSDFFSIIEVKLQ